MADANEETVGMSTIPRRDSSASKSPPPAHRISATSLDDVNLEESTPDDTSSRSRSSTLLSKISGVQAAAQTMVPSLHYSKPAAPAMDSPAPPPAPGKRPAPSPAPIRKLTSPFSWLSRTKSVPPKDVTSPPIPSPNQLTHPPNAAPFPGYTGVHPELMLSRIGDGHGSQKTSQDSWRASNGNTLRDRFKLQRMKEEAGIGPLGEPGGEYTFTRSTSDVTGHSLGDQNGAAIPGDAAGQGDGAKVGHTTSSSMSGASLAVDPNLAPGTAAGISAGPPSQPEAEALVDWDLWQALVYEGPAAVAQKSSDELSQAIASGIPSAIRGVVWQILANSKNEELERVFESLTCSAQDRASSKKAPAESSTCTTPTETTSPDVALGGAQDNGGEPKHAGSSDRVGSGELPSSTSAMNGHHLKVQPGGVDSESVGRGRADPLRDYDLDAAIPDPATLQKLEKAIKRDLGARTSFSKYAASAGLQDSLFKVCKAYALFDKAVGYAQGMNFLIMPLLFNMPEEEAFCLFVRLMYDYKLREMFIQEMPGLHLHLHQFQRLLEDHEPALFCHLHRRGVDPNLYATQWFLTLFAYRFPLQLVLRVYDLVLSEGLEGAILRFGLVLMQRNANTLLEMTDMSALTHFLKERLFDVYIDQAPSANSLLESGFFGSSGGSDKAIYRADALVQDACAVKLTVDVLKSYTDEWTEKVRLEKEREAEVEGLKSANASLSAKVRSLEERIEKFDTEHVQVASELVRTKVENEELREENETLKGELENLKRAFESQPREVEASLRDEMDRIMQRNLEVHNENRALEEQMTEMEKDLVDAKMHYAEINSSHEALKQKWNDLKKALGN